MRLSQGIQRCVVKCGMVATLGATWVAAGLLLAGCGEARTSSPAETLRALEQAFPNPGVSPAVQVAIAAARTNELGHGVIALQEARRSPGLSAEQLQAVDEAQQRFVRELLRRAESGDARAKADLAAIERSRSQ